VQEIENLNFTEAMNFLIDKFNIPVERNKTRSGIKKDVFAKINQKAMKYFRDNLLDSAGGKKAQEYLSKRGISRDTVELFSLGYAQNQWDGLYDYLRKHSGDIGKAIELGLLIKSEKHRVYDRFRGRIIFPIFPESDPQTPIAFGGRTIFDEPNKYLNSPDTPLYKKSKHLYGFHLTKKSIRETKYAILVEGYFDVISLYQNGIENSAASLGTALTENQVYLLKRFSDKVYIFYDSDKAGIDATLRGIEKMFEQNMNPGIIVLANTDAKDPDDFIKQHGVKAFHQLLENATDGFRFLIRHMTRMYDMRIPERKNDAVRGIMNVVEKISEPIIRNEYIRMVADFFKVDEGLLASRKKTRTPDSPGSSPERLTITPAERIFLENILAMPGLIGEIGEIKELSTNDLLSVLASKNMIRLLLEHYNQEKKEIPDLNKISGQLTEAEKGEFRDVFERSKTINKDRDQVEEDIKSCIVEFRNLFNKGEVRRINQQIKIAERENNIEMVKKKFQEKTKYIKSKYNIINKNKNLIEGAVD
jgi:DNA primase